MRNYLMLPAPDADTETGRAIYARSCSVCHGDRGDAASWAKNSLNPPPADFTAHGFEQVTREKMIGAVTFGKERSAMMPFAVQLGPEEIAATVDYTRTAFLSEGMGKDGDGHDHGGSHPQEAMAGAAKSGGLGHHHVSRRVEAEPRRAGEPPLVARHAGRASGACWPPRRQRRSPPMWAGRSCGPVRR